MATADDGVLLLTMAADDGVLPLMAAVAAVNNC